MPTAARQKYLAKQAAKKSDLLSESDRQGEYDKVVSQLTQVSDPEVDKFEALMSEWVKDGHVRQGVIPVPAIRRSICYSLGISRSKTFVSLKSDDTTAPVSTLESTVQDVVSATNQLDEEDELPELVPSTQARFEESLGEMTQEVLNNIGNTPTDEHYNQWLRTFQELNGNGNDEKLTDSTTTKISQDNKNEKNKNKNKNKNTNTKKQQTFVQPAPRGSRHASRPPAMKPKAQSA